MIGVNRVTLLGRLAADVETRTTKTGKPLAKLVIAVPRAGGPDAGADFIRVTAWETTAETCAKYLGKGEPVFVEGRISKSVWDDASGQKRSQYDISVQRIVFLGSRTNGNAEPNEEALPGGDDQE